MNKHPARVRGYLPTLIAGASLLLSLPVSGGTVSERCASAAQAVVASLSVELRPSVAVPFDTGARREWAFRPGSDIREEGLAFRDMSDEQRVLAHRLVACALSSQGYQKVVAIMHLDDIVMANFHETVLASLPGPFEMGNEFYWLAVFGDPAGDAPWGWQLEGHHLVLNFTVVDDAIAVTPAFLGADPAEVQRGPLAGWRVMGQEMDLAFALLTSLTDEQLETVILSDDLPQNVFTGAAGKGDVLSEYEGLPAAELNDNQQQRLWDLIGEYVNNADAVLAAKQMERIRADGLANIYFAWMGPRTPGNSVYYRIHGPSILIEYDHGQDLRSRQRKADPNHIHTIYRDPSNDHGEDWLRRHYAESPHHQ